MDCLLASLNDAKLQYLLDFSKDWALVNGLVCRTHEETSESDRGLMFPFALLPTPYPRQIVQDAIALQKDMNELYFRVSWDSDFLESSLSTVIGSDDFTGRLLDVYRQVRAEGVAQPISLQIQRPDYMLNAPANSPQTFKQVEVNNLAGGAALHSKTSLFHREILRQMRVLPWEEICRRVMKNPALETVASGLINAWKMYGEKPESIILFIVEKDNQNIADQRLVEYQLANAPFFCAVVTLSECKGRLKLRNEETRELLFFPIFGEQWTEVSVAYYYESGYDPVHYPTQAEWDAKLLIERSAAIKCPWIGFHLAGSKKIQQELAKPNVLEKYFPDDAERVGKIRDTFAGLWGLESDAEETMELIAKTRRSPADFVLKGQRESGGKNVFGADIHRLLEKLSPGEREEYILMERLRPPVNRNYLVRSGDPVRLVETVSELGTFGVFLGDGLSGRVLWSVDGGHSMRTKPSGVDEGGIMMGAAVHDTPCLV